MGKVEIEPTTMALPMSCVVVSCYEPKHGGNMAAIAFCGMVNAKPPMLAVSFKPNRFSHALIKGPGEFVVNVPLAEQVEKVDLAGVVSGRNLDKFDLAGLTKAPATQVNSPLIKEFPINLECRVLEVVELPTHNLFIGEVLAIHADESLVDDMGRLSLEKAPFLMYYNRGYFAIGERIGHFGFSKSAENEESQ
ncbi:MAG: flavin reductase family protein [Candidatus Coatesbacteria bacterium]|nr:flavin reductase family protein [Candidatus Coatesbacteria bacterium]